MIRQHEAREIRAHVVCVRLVRAKTPPNRKMLVSLIERNGGISPREGYCVRKVPTFHDPWGLMLDPAEALMTLADLECH